MKKTYTKPEIEITAFTTEDIITTSGMNTHDGTASGSAIPEINLDDAKWE